MDTNYVYTAILDVLAYRTLLEYDRQSGTLGFGDSLARALRCFDNINESSFNVRAISDTIILSCIDQQNFLEFCTILRKVFLSFLRQLIFVRGAIAFGQHFHNNRLTYSHALARAHELESQSADYPRIVVDRNIVDMHESSADLPKINGTGLLCKENEVYFLQILTRENWQEVHQCAQKIYNRYLAQPLAEAAFNKHVRFQRYLLESPHAIAPATPYIAPIEPY